MSPHRFASFAVAMVLAASISSPGLCPAAPGTTNAPPKINESAARLVSVTTGKADEYFPPPHGTQLKTRIESAKVTPSPQGELFSDVKVQTWLVTGEPDLILETPECLYIRESRTISSAGPLKMRTADGRFAMDGRGFTFFQTNSVLLISNQVHTTVHSANARSIDARQNPATALNEVEILANHFRYSHENGLGIYDGDVRVAGTNLAMTCGNAEVRVPVETRALQSILATGNVAMDYEMIGHDLRKIHATGDRALYLATNGITTITGHPTWAADQRKGLGDELILDSTNKIFRVNGNAELAIPAESLGESSFLPSPAQEERRPSDATNRIVEVKCDHYLFETNFASFGDEVHVAEVMDGKQFGAMNCAKMALYFAGTNQLDRMIAEQHVIIQETTNSFKADKAVYTATNHNLELTGNPSWSSGEREGNGDLVQVNLLSQEMTVLTNAFMRLPAGDLGQSLLVASDSGSTNSPIRGLRNSNPQRSTIQRPVPQSAFDKAGSNNPSSKVLLTKADSTNPPPFANITSERYTITTNSALFNGSVRVAHPQMDWACESLSVESFSKEGKDLKLVAEGDVDFHIANEAGQSMHGVCEKTVYTYKIVSGVTNDVAVLTGNPILEAEQGTVTNSVIILDLANHTIRAPGKYRLYGQAQAVGTNVLNRIRNPSPGKKR